MIVTLHITPELIERAKQEVRAFGDMVSTHCPLALAIRQHAPRAWVGDRHWGATGSHRQELPRQLAMIVACFDADRQVPYGDYELDIPEEYLCS